MSMSLSNNHKQGEVVDVETASNKEETRNVTDADMKHESIMHQNGINIPTRMDIYYDLNGSLGFAVGSSGYILSMYFQNWLPYFRYGSLTWIWGCLLYSIPLLLKLKHTTHKMNQSRCQCNSQWDIGDLGEFLCYLFYIIGCILGGFFDEEQVEEFLPVINHTFVYGSFSLALKPTYQLLLFLKGKVNSERRESDVKLRGFPSKTKDESKSSSMNHNERAGLSELLTSFKNLDFWDRILELTAIVFFCAAGVFGGFPPHPSLALPGVYFWEVGSLFSVARSLLMIYRRDLGLKYLKNRTLESTEE